MAYIKSVDNFIMFSSMCAFVLAPSLLPEILCVSIGYKVCSELFPRKKNNQIPSTKLIELEGELERERMEKEMLKQENCVLRPIVNNWIRQIDNPFWDCSSDSFGEVFPRHKEDEIRDIKIPFDKIGKEVDEILGARKGNSRDRKFISATKIPLSFNKDKLKIQRLEDQVRNIRDELGRQNKNNEILMEEKNKLELLMHTVNQEKDKLQEEVSRLQKKERDLKNEIRVHKGKIHETECKMQNFESLHNKLYAEISEARAKNENYLKKLQEREDEINRLVLNERKCRAEYKSLDAKNEEIFGENQFLKCKLQQEEQNLQRMTDKLNLEAKNVIELQEELGEKDKKIMAQVLELKRMKNYNQEFEKAFRNIIGENKHLIDENQFITKQLEMLLHFRDNAEQIVMNIDRDLGDCLNYLKDEEEIMRGYYRLPSILGSVIQ
ncbi:putative leucine-rich repeat-containing protein DDB_G0290503 [Palaemon carinicauda]|uniref:putative leucine-rich repeat-containing protein DDB_G0290503 n=1 Tax=Palaemon carinicauda TaxID=392227 RepID=UPI0035B65E57